MSNGVKVCYSTTIGGTPIELQSTGKGRYRVVYGLEEKEDLNYMTAANRLGQCIMHALACEGKVEDDAD